MLRNKWALWGDAGVEVKRDVVWGDAKISENGL